jgi:hypothetical protein
LPNTHLLFTRSDLPVDFFDQPNLLADPSHNPQVINPLCFVSRFGVHSPTLHDIPKIRISEVRNVGKVAAVCRRSWKRMAGKSASLSSFLKFRISLGNLTYTHTIFFVPPSQPTSWIVVRNCIFRSSLVAHSQLSRRSWGVLGGLDAKAPVPMGANCQALNQVNSGCLLFGFDGHPPDVKYGLTAIL